MAERMLHLAIARLRERIWVRAQCLHWHEAEISESIADFQFRRCSRPSVNLLVPMDQIGIDFTF